MMVAPPEAAAQQRPPSPLQAWLDRRGWTLAALLFGLTLVLRAIDGVPPLIPTALIAIVLLLMLYLESRHARLGRRFLSDYERDHSIRDAGGHGTLSGLVIGVVCGALVALQGYVALAIAVVLACGLGGAILGRVWGSLTRRRSGMLTRLLTLAATVVALAAFFLILIALVQAV